MNTGTIKNYIQKEPIFFAAVILALISLVFVPPDSKYIKYIDFKTLGCLLCLMIALKGMEREGLLNTISVKLASGMKSLRALAFLLVFICFFSAMIMTNDVALIAIVPITLTVLSMCGLEKYAAIIIVLQTLAANIGSSLTPIGNPQNLYLFMHYKWEAANVLLTMFPFILFGGILIGLICTFLPKQSIEQNNELRAQSVKKNPIIAYGIMFIIAVCAVFGLIPYWIAIILIAAATAIVDKKTLLKVDYNLLLTFIAIFILVGNLARIEEINALLRDLVKRDTMLAAVITSQFISNVPSAIMLSGFTNNSRELLIGVNIGGMGTLIASMASVISYKLYADSYKKGTLKYLGLFSVLNIVFLMLSLVFVNIIE